MHLARMAGRPGFGRSLWSAAWRLTLAWMILTLVAYFEPWFDRSYGYEDSLFGVAAFSAIVSVLFLGVYARFSLPARCPVLARNAWLTAPSVPSCSWFSAFSEVQRCSLLRN
jgi:hypothetical protein